MVKETDFEMGKQYIIEGLETLLGLYVKFPLGLSLLGLAKEIYGEDDDPISKDYRAKFERLRVGKLCIDTLVNDLKAAKTVEEIKLAFDNNKWFIHLIIKAEEEGADTS